MEKEPFICVLESVKKEFTMFLPDGIPVRARLTLTLKEFKMELNEREKAQQSPIKQKFTLHSEVIVSGSLPIRPMETQNSGEKLPTKTGSKIRDFLNRVKNSSFHRWSKRTWLQALRLMFLQLKLS